MRSGQWVVAVDPAVGGWTLHVGGTARVLTGLAAPAGLLCGDVALSFCEGFAAGEHGAERGAVRPDFGDFCCEGGGSEERGEEVGDVHDGLNVVMN